MKSYELTYLISPEISETEAKLFQEKLISLFQENGGILDQTKEPIKKKLAYPIRKKDWAYLATLNFQINPEGLRNIEKKIKSESQILRYLVLIKPQTKPPTTFRKKMVGEKPTIHRKKVVGGKVELKEIEKKLEEILGE